MHVYFCRGGGAYDGRMVPTEERNGFMVLDAEGQFNGDGQPWMWIYKLFEVWVGEGDDREFRGYYWECEDADGAPLNVEASGVTGLEQVVWEPEPNAAL